MNIYILVSRYLLLLLSLLASLPSVVVNAQSSKIQITHPVVDVSSLIAKNTPIVLAANTPTYAITITVTNIRSREGVIRFKFYDDSTPFPHDTGFLRIVVPKTDFEGNSFTVTYTGFTAKNMAIALGDDENNNVELDMGWFLPKEGHAFSDYYHTSMRRPVYDDFDFFLNGDKKVVMKMRYY
jgi:uncharacterized protein (DUF2141 family)